MYRKQIDTSNRESTRRMYYWPYDNREPQTAVEQMIRDGNLKKIRDHEFVKEKISSKIRFHAKVDRDQGTSKSPTNVSFRFSMARSIGNDILDLCFIHCGKYVIFILN